MRITILDIQKMKDRGEKIPMVTAYDYTSAQMVDRAGIPLMLVGDTLGMVVLGHPTTIPVTMDDMLHHIKAVTRGAQEALVIGDLPFLAYSDEERAVVNAGRVLQEGGAQAVKLEGGRVAPIARRLVDLGIPVMGHVGLTPQSVNQLGGMRVQGRQVERARGLLEDAVALQEAGAFAIVLELVPQELAAAITERLRIPTIGIGAGAQCGGQVLVWHDLLGMYSDFVPRHTKVYARLGEQVTEALTKYASEVRDGRFPMEENSSSMDEGVLREALGQEGG